MKKMLSIGLTPLRNSESFNSQVSNLLRSPGPGPARFSQRPVVPGTAVPGLTDEVAAGQIEDLFAVDRRIEVPVEVFQRFESVEVGGFGAAREHALMADVEFVLEDQFEELAV